MPGATFEEGVEHIPGPGNFVVRVEPSEAIDERSIVFTAYEDHPTVLFRARRAEHGFLSGLDLPSTLRASVDGIPCAGSMELVSDMEADGTLRVDADSCALALDLQHRTGAIEHHLEELGPVAS